MTYGLKSTPNLRFFLRNFAWQTLFTLRVFAENLLRENRRRTTFRISFWCLAWDSNPSQHTTYQTTSNFNKTTKTNINHRKSLYWFLKYSPLILYNFACIWTNCRSTFPSLIGWFFWAIDKLFGIQR